MDKNFPMGSPVQSVTDLASESRVDLPAKMNVPQPPIKIEQNSRAGGVPFKERKTSRARLTEQADSFRSGAEKLGQTEFTDERGEKLLLEQFAVKRARYDQKDRVRNIYTVKSLNSAAMSSATYTHPDNAA